VVEGLNLRKKHSKPKKSGEKGQIIQIPASIDVSDIMVICPKCAKASRLGFKIEGKNKYRVCKKCGSEI
jgi:large subunit ribosomal protein L24